MAAIRTFDPLVYNESLRTELESLIAPPYDVIDAVERRRLAEGHANNIVHLTLPEQSEDDASRYAASARMLNSWIDDGSLVRTGRHSLFGYTQRFEHPIDGTTYLRSGFLCMLDLVDFGPEGVLPHERTLQKHRLDRLNLRTAVKADLEPIFGMYEPETTRPLSYGDVESTPFLSSTDRLGVTHTLARFDDVSSQAIIDRLADRTVTIVDGHHRYTTALEYARTHDLKPGDPGASILIFLCPMSDDGLVILPTHRLVFGLDESRLDPSAFDEALTEWFEVRDFPDRDTAIDALESSQGRSFLFVLPNRTLLATLRQDASERLLERLDVHGSLFNLDVTILHDLVFERILGISKEAQEAGTNLSYTRDQSDGLAAVGTSAMMLAMFRPPSLSDVRLVAESGNVMPQKSTYFYPKLASGLVIAPFDAHL